MRMKICLKSTIVSQLKMVVAARLRGGEILRDLFILMEKKENKQEK